MERILGQSRAVDQLRRALGAGRMHHAWIFSGPQGVGKCTTAIELARILLDPQAAPDLAGNIVADPDGAVSHLIDGGVHPDLHVVRKELALFSGNRDLRSRKLLNIPLDLLREQMLGGRTGDGERHAAAVYQSASRGHGKIFIIDEAELLEPVAQNALLKTLEEPPAQTYLFLVTSRPQRLLPTIMSRCHHVRFGRLDEEAMTRWFRQAGFERAIDDEERNWITRFAEGAPGIAVLAADYGFHGWEQTLAPMLRQLGAGEYPAELGETLAGLVEAFAQAWVKAHDNASKDAANKDGARHVLSLLGAHARRRIVQACETGDDATAWLDMIDRLRDAEAHLASNVNLKLVMENLAVQWGAEAVSSLPPHVAATR